MGRAQSETYSSLFTKSDNVNLDETFDRKSALVHVLNYIILITSGIIDIHVYVSPLCLRLCC